MNGSHAHYDTVFIGRNSKVDAAAVAAAHGGQRVMVIDKHVATQSQVRVDKVSTIWQQMTNLSPNIAAIRMKQAGVQRRCLAQFQTSDQLRIWGYDGHCSLASASLIIVTEPDEFVENQPTTQTVL